MNKENSSKMLFEPSAKKQKALRVAEFFDENNPKMLIIPWNFCIGDAQRFISWDIVRA